MFSGDDVSGRMIYDTKEAYVIKGGKNERKEEREKYKFYRKTVPADKKVLKPNK